MWEERDAPLSRLAAAQREDIAIAWQYNRLVASPTLFVEDREEFLVWINDHKEGKQKQAKQVTAHLEAYACEMISNCAVNITLPSYSPLSATTDLKRALSPSIRRRVRFADGRNSLWKAVKHYFFSLREQERVKPTSTKLGAGLIGDLEWGIYQLIIASRQGAEALVSIDDLLLILDVLRKDLALSGEVGARLAVIEGVLRSFERRLEIPGLCVYRSATGVSLRERLEEVVEDAYLLEASYLRRHFGLGANLASLRRDLRKLTKYISANRPWAKGLIKAGSVVGQLGSTEATSELLDAFGQETNSVGGASVCLEPRDQYRLMLKKENSVVLVFGRDGDRATITSWEKHGDSVRHGARLWSSARVGLGFYCKDSANPGPKADG